MNLILSGRGVQLDERLRGYATDKFTKVERFFDRIIRFEVELRRERNPRVADPHRATVLVKTPLDTLRAVGEGADPFAAIDVAADKLGRQVRRLKERVNEHPHRNNSLPQQPLEATEPDGPVVVRASSPVAKPVSVDEAIVELDTRGLNFLVFTDAETMRPSVVYHRGDGRYGLIESTT